MFDGGPVSAADLHPPLPSGELVPLRLVTVLLAEDHAVIRQALRVLIESTGLFAVVGEVADGAEAVETALALNPDVILMDVSMPVLDGLAATQQILKTNPAARILILSANSERECLERTVAVGALGYLRKESSAEDLSQALLQVARGKAILRPAIPQPTLVSHWRATTFASQRSSLTTRETDVLRSVAYGMANKQTAAEMGISIKTVEKHRQQVMNKLGIHHTAGLTRYAIAAGVADRDWPTRTQAPLAATFR